MNNQELTASLNKFLEWNAEQDDIKKELKDDDCATLLLQTLYGDPTPAHTAKLIGGSNAPILYDAAIRIKRLQESLSSVLLDQELSDNEIERLRKLIFNTTRNDCKECSNEE